MISIIIPAYNVESNIHKTINSVLAQTDYNFELIVVNDGSTDKTIEVVEDFLSKSNFFNYKIIDKKNGGASSARNAGIEAARGDYIYFLDGDDYISSDMIAKIRFYVNKGRPDIVAWGYNTVKEDGSTIINFFDLFNSAFLQMTGVQALKSVIIHPKRFWIWTCSAVYKRSFLVNNGLMYTEGCSNGEDQEFTFKALSKSESVYFINEILSFYVQREGSISNSYNIKRFQVIDAIKRSAQYIKNNNTMEIHSIVNYLEYTHLIEHYLINFNSSIEYLGLKSKVSIFQIVNYLMGEIDRVYPGLNDDIKSRMEKNKEIKLKTKIRYKLFLTHPFYYVLAVRLNDRLSG